MKVKVIKLFRDKEDNLKAKKVGTEMEVSEKRYEELTTSPLGVFVKEIKEKKE